MKILIDINHPGHVHLFRNFIKLMKDRGHLMRVCVKDITAAKYLLHIYDIEYIDLGSKDDSLKFKLINQLKYDWKISKIVKDEKINIGLGTSVSLPHVSLFSSMRSILLDDDDDEVEPLFVKFAHPFADTILSPDVLDRPKSRKKLIRYSGYHELAYLHPNCFNADPSVLHENGLNTSDIFFVLRFNVFKAHHDIGAKGLSLDQKLNIIDILSKKGKVILTTEREVEKELCSYQFISSPEQIHSLLYYSTLFIGDSQTMTSEAAVLGTPAIRCNTFVGKISYLEEEANKYALTFGFLPSENDRLIKKINELLSMNNLKEEWKKRRKKMLDDKIDVTAFLVWFVENYPQSVKIMKENPEYQYRFR